MSDEPVTLMQSSILVDYKLPSSIGVASIVPGQKGIGLTFVADGGERPMARDKLHFVAQAEQL